HGVGEILQVAARLPDGGVHQDRRVDAHHVRSALHEVPPPDPLDVALELDPQRAVVPARARAAVDLARLEDEPAALAERDERVHRDHAGQDSTARKRTIRGAEEWARTPSRASGASGRGSARTADSGP